MITIVKHVFPQGPSTMITFAIVSAQQELTKMAPTVVLNALKSAIHAHQVPTVQSAFIRINICKVSVFPLVLLDIILIATFALVVYQIVFSAILQMSVLNVMSALLY